jgi:hypothetical protein
VNVLANRRPRALVISAVRIVTNVFWVLYLKFLPSSLRDVEPGLVAETKSSSSAALLPSASRFHDPRLQAFSAPATYSLLSYTYRLLRVAVYSRRRKAFITHSNV